MRGVENKSKRKMETDTDWSDSHARTGRKRTRRKWERIKGNIKASIGKTRTI